MQMQMQMEMEMPDQVQNLTEADIEHKAEKLLAECAENCGRPLALPIPAYDIAVNHLAFQLEFVDMHEAMGVPMLRGQPYILGRTLFAEETILIDRSLNPENFPSLRGRFRFTVAHEIGHALLHGDSVDGDQGRAPLSGASLEPITISRSSQTIQNREKQADYFAACLLMPQHWVRQLWKDRLGRTTPMTESSVRTNRRVTSLAKCLSRHQRISEDEAKTRAFFELKAKPLAEEFDVSLSAMRMRLQDLGLILLESPRRRSWDR